ncbi:class I SAM-dependent methyltransferase [Kribbella amoyensis]|uniref:class I SAM-dependent methyltransferase n=1 Tax=Kribbella amoyensis TaxID=996641 RepID=UPI0014796F63
MRGGRGGCDCARDCGGAREVRFLAERGFRVDGIDLIPDAIELARRFARERGVEVAFSVQDVCAMADEPARKEYDLIVDSYCLQWYQPHRRHLRPEALRAELGRAGFRVLSQEAGDLVSIADDE